MRVKIRLLACMNFAGPVGHVAEGILKGSKGKNERVRFHSFVLSFLLSFGLLRVLPSCFQQTNKATPRGKDRAVGRRRWG